MSWLDHLERRWGRWALPQLTLALLCLQVPVYVISLFQPELLGLLQLVPQQVLRGQWWRLFSFVAVAPQIHPIFAFFYFYLFYLMGTALESHWGAFRYNLYLLLGYVATVAAAFATPTVPTPNAYLMASVFLAFAYLYPEFELYLFFVVPVQVRYLAWLTWAVYGYEVLFGTWAQRLAVAASVVNFFVFFGVSLLRRMRQGSRTRRWHRQVLSSSAPSAARHQCRICGRTEKTDPQLEFRYCTKCVGTPCYCEDHIFNHEHLQPSGSASSAENGSRS